MSDDIEIFGVCWFQPEQWDRLIQISDDRDKLEDSYEEWRVSANSAIHEIRESGRIVRKVKIDLESLLMWCNDKGIPVNGAARAEYVAKHMYNNQKAL